MPSQAGGQRRGILPARRLPSPLCRINFKSHSLTDTVGHLEVPITTERADEVQRTLPRSSLRIHTKCKSDQHSGEGNIPVAKKCLLTRTTEPFDENKHACRGQERDREVPMEWITKGWNFKRERKGLIATKPSSQRNLGRVNLCGIRC